MSRAIDFWARVDADGDCWLWIGAIDGDGYGTCTVRRAKARAHRVAYELLVGPIPAGLTIDHLCRVRHCVNPDHLEPVTNRENVQRGARLRGSHCKWGHRKDAANTLLQRTASGGIRRQCRTCWTGYFRKYRASARAAQAA